MMMNVSALRLSEANAPRSLVERPTWLDRAQFPYEIRRVTVEDARLSYVDVGAGPTLLFVHGSPMWSFMWRFVIDALSHEYRCVAVDLPGLGLSEASLPKGRAFSRSSHLLEGFVRALGLERFTLIAHATGGPPALAMAVRTKRAERIVLTNTFAWPLDDDPRLGKFVRIVSSAPFAFLNVVFGFLPRIAAWRGRRAPPFSPSERAAVLGPYRVRRRRSALQNYLLSLRRDRPMLEQLLRRMVELEDTPALLVFGGRDNGYQAGTMTRFESMFRRRRSHVIEDAGHFLVEDDPMGFVEVLKAWLAE